MRSGKFTGAVLACLALCGGAAACGSDDGSPQTTAAAVTGANETDNQKAPGTDSPENEPSTNPADDEAAITDTLEQVLAGSDPERACTELVTERFLRRSYGDEAGCRAAQKSTPPAKTAGVSQVVIEPDSVAQALSRPQGGIYDGQRLRAELVLDDGTWKLDSLRSNVPVGP
jgi:hypothetical protein